MKALYQLILLLCLFSFTKSYSMVEKINYRGWEDCYLISNTANIRVIINASAGGRIMAYESDGVNIIYEDPKQDGKLLKDYQEKWFDPDGGRFDYGQEITTRQLHDLTYMGSWEAEILDDYSLKITSQPDSLLGILSTRIFALDPASSKLSVTQTMKNISNSSTEYFFWGRTLVKTGGKFFIPLNPESSMPDQWGRYVWGEKESFSADPDDPGVSINKNILSILPSTAKNNKYGTDSEDGWMAYGYEGLLFVKKYNYYESMPYTEFYGQTNILYTKKNLFIEMEPISPTAKLEPGEEYSYTEYWYLLDFPKAQNTDFSVKKAARKIGKLEFPEE